MQNQSQNVINLGRLEDIKSPNSLERSFSPDNKMKNNFAEANQNKNFDPRQQMMLQGGMINKINHNLEQT